MDFLRTMLVYMSVLFLMGVEGAATPEPGSIPTPAPASTAVAQTQPDATPAAVQATVAPSVTLAPAAPTMTANPRYPKLSYGDKNNNVKKMQKRLIELGYMKPGTDDGAYGYNTLNAVREFQKANGLSADGIAGKATLTHLYEDPNVVPAATATPAPTATPQAAQPEGTEAVETGSVTASWYRTGATVLLNGSKLVLLDRSTTMVTERSPAVYLHDGLPMIEMGELARSAGWTMTSQNADGFTLEAEGYHVAITLGDHSDLYEADVDGAAVTFAAGDIVYEDGSWLVRTTVLEKTIGASSVWYQDENTLVLHVTEKSAAGSRD